MKQLIVNADDFGLHKAVNEGIMKGHEEGIITSTSLLATGDAFEEAVALAKTSPKLGIGIHTTLVGGLRPASDPAKVSSLLVDGRFPLTHVEFLKRLYSGKVKMQEIFDELRAQFEIIMNSGLHVTHVDGHQHLHVLPQVIPMVVSLMKEYGIDKVRIPDESFGFLNGVYSPVRAISKWGLAEVSRKAYEVTRDAGISSPLYFWGMMNGGQLTEPALMKILGQVAKKRGVHEIMTHPGNDNHTLENTYGWHYHWEEELSGLTSPLVKRFIENNEIELINYGEFTYGGV